MEMITSKSKALLRKRANGLKPSCQIGKGGLTAALLATIDAALEAHELIKIKILTNQSLTLPEVATAIAEKTGATLVTTIGRVEVFYRPSKKNRRIVIE
jgi:RNA-binding protein